LATTVIGDTFPNNNKLELVLAKKKKLIPDCFLLSFTGNKYLWVRLETTLGKKNSTISCLSLDVNYVTDEQSGTARYPVYITELKKYAI
jgi:hypothetical protein